jgi:hypothetical protein
MKSSKIEAQGFFRGQRFVQTKQWHGHEFDGKILDEIQIHVTLESKISVDLLIDMLTIVKTSLHKPGYGPDVSE